MKLTVFIALTTTKAIKLSDAPSAYNGPYWTQNHPSAAGFVQLSKCDAAGVNGVTCGPTDIELFATGMNGDEDLGQDITMEGEKFHYQQQQLIALNGDDAVPPPEKVSVLDPKIAK